MAEKNGYWANTTSSIDWCEINYEITYFIVEFWNTLSNLPMILLPLYGLYWSLRQNSNRKLRKYRVPRSILLCFVALAIIGCGSFLFHMTLYYSMQLLDEVPMIFGSGVSLFTLIDMFLSLFEYDRELKQSRMLNAKPYLKKEIFKRYKLAVLITLYCSLVAFIYIFIWPNPVFHQICFGIVLVTALIVYLFSYWKYSNIYKIPNRLVCLILFYGILAFIFWNMDKKFCHYLIQYRRSVELFFGISEENSYSDHFEIKAICFNILVIWLKSLSEFHSWWHILSSYTGFLCILFLIEFNYEHHLRLSKITDDQSNDRPLESKCCDMYYFLTNENKNNCDCFTLKYTKLK
jgi:dihydroceramidase